MKNMNFIPEWYIENKKLYLSKNIKRILLLIIIFDVILFFNYLIKTFQVKSMEEDILDYEIRKKDSQKTTKIIQNINSIQSIEKLQNFEFQKNNIQQISINNKKVELVLYASDYIEYKNLIKYFENLEEVYIDHISPLIIKEQYNEFYIGLMLE